MLRRLLKVTLPAVIVAVVAGAMALEAWVRLSWDAKRGMPSFYVSLREAMNQAPLRRDQTSREGWLAQTKLRQALP